MNQTIGIEYTVKGYEKVTRVFSAMSKTLKAFITQVDSLNASLIALKGNMTFSGLSSQVIPMREATSALAGYTAAAERYNKVAKRGNVRAADSMAVGLQIHPSKTREMWEKQQRIAAQSTIPYVQPVKAPRARKHTQAAGPPSTHRQDSSGMPWALGAVPYALRFGATAGAIYGAGSLAKQTILGESRKEIVKSMRDIGALGFTRNDVLKIEEWADDFLKKFWVGGGKTEALSTVAEVGSAFDPNDSPYFKSVEHGRITVQRMAEQSMILGSATKMASDEAGKLLTSVVQAQLAFMKPEVSAQYKNGIKDIGDLSEQTAAKLGAAVRVTAIWGKEIQAAFAYELPGALKEGWDLETLLSYSGMLTTAGIPATRSARALRMFMEKGPEDMAYLWLAGSEDPSVRAKFKAMPEKDRKKYAELIAPQTKKMFNADPFGFAKQLHGMLTRAEDEGYLLGKILDTDFTQIFRAFVQPEMLANMERIQKAIRTGDFTTLEKFAREMQHDPGLYMTRINNAWQAMTQKLSLFAEKSGETAGLVEAFTKPMYSVMEWLENKKDGGELFFEVNDLFARISWGIFQGVTSPLRWVSNMLLGTNLGWVNWGEFQQATSFLITDIKNAFNSLTMSVNSFFVWLAGALNSAESYIRGKIPKSLPIAPGKVPADMFPNRTPDAVQNMFNNQLPPANMQPAHSQPIKIENVDKVQLESKIYLDFNQIGQAVQEFERRNEIQRGRGFGDYVGDYSGGY